MAVIRCPNCGKPNPDFIDVCQYCDKPLKEGAAPPAAAVQREAAPTAAEIPDWMRGGEAAPEPESAPGAAKPKEEPEWMWTGAGDSASEAPAAPAEVPDWMKGGAAFAPSAPAAPEPAGEIPEWMKGGAAFAPSAPAAPEPAAEVPDWVTSGEAFAPSAPAAPEPAVEVPDWVTSGETFAPSAPAAPEPAGGVPDWMKSGEAFAPSEPAPSFGAPAEETPAWMSGGESAAPSFTPPVEEAPPWMSGAEPAAPAPPAAEEVPDWIASMRAAAAPAEPAPAPFAAPAADMPDWMSSLGGESAAPAEPAPAPFAAPAADMPDWMSSLGGAPAAPAEPAPSPFAVPVDSAAPEWMKDLNPNAPGVSESPDWLAGLAAPAETPAASSAPPFAISPPEADTPDWLAPAAGAAAASLFGAAAEPPSAAPAAPSAPSTGLPKWLSAMRPKDAGAAPSAPGGAVASTALPSWLAAMRPVEVDAPVPSAEKDSYEETVGVLAGMRGVLRAEPSVALPTKTAVSVHELAVDSAQAQIAAVLSALLQEDAEAAPASRRRFRLPLPFDRLLVLVLLAFVVIAVPVFAPALFPLPTTIAPEAEAAFDLIDAVPVDRPVLVAFDYEPAQLGELNPSAQALVAHVMRRGAPIVALSTRAAGAPLADEQLQQLAVEHGYGYGANFVNLGYVPGGPVGLLQFAANPRSLFPGDFRATPDLWSLPITQRLAGLNSFGLIILISASPDDARAWVEQTQRYAVSVPIVAAVSAGAAPLVRPYYESSPRQISALVVGIIGAAQYEQRAGAPGGASLRWNALNGGLITAAALIMAGNLAHAALHLLRWVRRQRSR